MRLKRLAHSLLAVLVLFGGIQLSIPSAHADTVSIIPPKFEVFGNPGDTLTEKLKVNNSSVTEGTYQVQVEDFRAQGDDGSVDLVEDGSPRTSYSLASWITTEPSSFTVAAGQEKVVTFTIKIPKTGEPGGHYASVLIKKAGQTAPGSASVDSRIGSLVLLRVSGNVTESLTLDSFTTDSYSQYGPVNFKLLFTNNGNVHIAPTGTIVISNLFGQKVKEIPVSGANVLPGANRLVTATWDSTNLVGRYTATYQATYGTPKQNLAATVSFVVFPVYLIFVVIIVIALVYLLIAKRKSLKRLINNITSD